MDSTGYIGNPNLLPESAQGWEVGFTTDLPAFARRDGLSFGATYFNEQITNLIETVFPSPTFSTSENVGSAHIQGVETQLTIRPVAWFALDATYTWTQPLNADTGMMLLRRSQNTASVDATITPIPKLRVVPEVLFTGSFQDFLIDDSGFSTGTTGTSRQGTIVNLTITYDINPRISAYANGRNILNSRFEPVNGFQTPGRELHRRRAVPLMTMSARTEDARAAHPRSPWHPSRGRRAGGACRSRSPAAG